ncbi:MAG: molybdopterin-synthase adenylyltransferase MoeB [Phyllobacteriaceae bacterium]|jgi:molybdopterin/thiamine biosynthesis adenylyltransferase|nr:molybdopterin-synthase adenylyltransferase MoeB [Phyllobacteriaceae bacterium]
MAEPPALNAEQIERYARHIVLPEIGGAGQQKLSNARIAVIGAGGLGSPALTYLAAAGVGRLTVIDDDDVSLSNLQRQTLHMTHAVGQPKVTSAAAHIAAINPHVRVDCRPERLAPDNAEALLSGHDVIMDGSDNFDTRRLAADMAERLETPLVTGAIQRFDGSVTVFAPFRTDDDGRPLPRYRDLYPDLPAPGTVPTCAEAGVLGALAGVIGSLMATEAIKLVTGAGEPLYGRLLLYDALSTRFETMRYGRRA